MDGLQYLIFSEAIIVLAGFSGFRNLLKVHLVSTKALQSLLLLLCLPSTCCGDAVDTVMADMSRHLLCAWSREDLYLHFLL